MLLFWLWSGPKMQPPAAFCFGALPLFSPAGSPSFTHVSLCSGGAFPPASMFLPNPTTLGMRRFPSGVTMYSVRKVPSERSSSQTPLEKTRNHEETPTACLMPTARTKSWLRAAHVLHHCWCRWRCSTRHFCLLAP